MSISNTAGISNRFFFIRNKTELSDDSTETNLFGNARFIQSTKINIYFITYIYM